MNQQSDALDLPDIKEKEESEDEEDYNPFMVSHKQEPFHSFERLFQNHFDIQSNRWIVIPRNKINLLKSAMNKLKSWLIYLRREHQMIQGLLVQNEELRNKLYENQKLIANLYAAERLRTDQLFQEIHRLKQEIKERDQVFKDEISEFQALIKEKDKKIAKQEITIQRLNDVSNTYENQNKKLQADLTSSQKEFQLINNLKKFNCVDEKSVQGGRIQTFELILSTKVKKFILGFLSLTDYQSLMRCNKKLYLALIQHNTIIPHAVNALGSKYKSQLKVLQSVNEEFKTNIKQSQDPQLREIMIKQFELKVNFTEFIIPALRETQSLIDGDNFINLKANAKNRELLEQLEGFLQQQSLSYKAALQSLLQDKFPWNEFFPSIQNTLQQVQAQRKQFPNQSQMFAQQIMQRLYDLSAVCAQDSSTFGMFLTQLQRSVASLFVYSQHLTQETNQLQSLNYFMMTKIFFILKEKKKHQDQVEDLNMQLELYSEAKKFLNERVLDLERIVREKNEKIGSIQEQVVQKESLIAQNAIMVQKNNESMRLYKDKLKILAREVMEMRRKYKSTCREYNEVVLKFNSFKCGLEKLEQREGKKYN